ncbi:MAG: S41 family peptidase [Gemmatimonadetes bacterium]|nr:S41 family peptidase [Gemmatimonadota bacterium]MYD14587.1 S41 family peptidase [Gemmatimonadota bacterium]MYI67059.1 S41 family peptidase [Gemmatimonadota bacterium]
MSRILRFMCLAAALAVVAAPLGAQNPRTDRNGPPGTDTGSEGARIFLRALERISLDHVSALGDSALWELAIQGLIEQLNDPYATVFTEEEYGQFTETNTGNYAGIGVQISNLGSRVTVTAVFRDTPADGVGMLVGDEIVWVEGHDARDWTIDMARDSIRGEPGSVVNIRVERDGYAEPIPFAIKRDNVHVPALASSWAGEGIAHFGIDRIARGVAGELDAALLEYRGASALIIDLRSNPGGLLDESLQVTDLFLAPNQTLVSVSNANSQGPGGDVETQAWSARSPPRIPDTPIIVLVDGFTASAAEIIAGALQDHDRAVVIGERTFGKGSVQTVYPLAAGRRLRITTGSWYTPLGRSLHRVRQIDGTPIPEAEEELGWVETAGGRRLRTGGGVFPDLVVEQDMPKPEELALINHASEAQVPIGVMVREYALELVKDARDAGAIELLPSSAFNGLARNLIERGMDEEIVQNPVAREYLERWTQLRYLYRADAREQRLLVLAETDRVLAEALRLARGARTRTELFAMVEAARPESSER